MAQATQRHSRRSFLAAIPAAAAAVATLPVAALASPASPRIAAMLNTLADFAEAAPRGFVAAIEFRNGITWYAAIRTWRENPDIIALTREDASRLRELAVA